MATPATDDLLISYAELFGVVPMTASVSTATAAQDFDAILDKVQAAAGGLAGQIERVIVFAKPTAFSQIRFSDSMAKAFTYVAPYDERNLFYQRHELYPVFQPLACPVRLSTLLK